MCHEYIVIHQRRLPLQDNCKSRYTVSIKEHSSYTEATIYELPRVSRVHSDSVPILIRPNPTMHAIQFNKCSKISRYLSALTVFPIYNTDMFRLFRICNEYNLWSDHAITYDQPEDKIIFFYDEDIILDCYIIFYIFQFSIKLVLLFNRTDFFRDFSQMHAYPHTRNF